MSSLKPQTRFLLRGSALLVAMLSLWWFALLTPLLRGLQGAGAIAGGIFLGGRSSDLIRENPDLSWTFHVPLERTLPAGPGRPLAQQIHSIDFDIPRADIVTFTFSLPVLWAILLAAPGLRRNLRPLALGTALMAGLEVALLLLFAEIEAHKAAQQFAGAEAGAFEQWSVRFGDYLLSAALPYVLPFVVAFAVHRELRWRVFEWSLGERPPGEHAPTDTADSTPARTGAGPRPGTSPAGTSPLTGTARWRRRSSSPRRPSPAARHRTPGSASDPARGSSPPESR